MNNAIWRPIGAMAVMLSCLCTMAGDFTLSQSSNNYSKHRVRYTAAGAVERNSYRLTVPSGFTATVSVIRDVGDYLRGNNDKSKDRFYVSDSSGYLNSIADHGIITYTGTYKSDATISISCYTAPDYYREMYWIGSGNFRRLTYKDVYYTSYFVQYEYSIKVEYSANSGGGGGGGAVDLGGWSFSKLKDTIPAEGGKGSVVITCDESVWSAQ